MTTLLRADQIGQGFTPVFGADKRDPLTRLYVGRLKLESGVDAFAGQTGEDEMAIHVLVGLCSVSIGGHPFARLGDRMSVFADCPHVLHLPPNTSFAITPGSPSVDISLVRCRTDKTFAPYVVRPSDARIHTIGDGPTRRTVREIIGERAPGDLRLGETINPPGGWSSYPPHSFDRDPALAADFEEVFLYVTNPRGGFGLQPRRGLLCDGSQIDDVVRVGSGDYAILPLGEHPIAAGPDNQLWYAWYYLSPIPKHYSRWAEETGGYA